MIHRRRFLVRAGGAAAIASGALASAPAVMAQPRIQWRMSTAWPKQLDNLHGAAVQLAQLVHEMSDGRFRIEVFPGGQIMEPFECFDATSKGTIETYMGASSYWTAKDPASEWFISIPFGMDPQGMAVWCYQGDGLKLWEETYAPFNILPRLGPGFAPQMGDGSGGRSTRSRTTRVSRCASRASAAGSSRGRAARRSSRPPPTSTAPSSGV
jgi:TRAP-type mannitol/chloroaromatic compound transport system substrate-binding protein